MLVNIKISMYDIHTYIHACIHTYIHTYIYLYTYVYANKHRIYIYAHFQNMICFCKYIYI